jgi:transmembrane sensor
MEKLEDDRINDLIGKMLTGEASADEQQLVMQWRALSAVNEKYFNHCRTIFERASGIQDVTVYDTDAAWKKLRERIHNNKTKSLFPAYAWKVAAGLLLLSIVGIGAYQLFSNVERLEVASSTSIVNETLPDGTTVTLNKQTQLAVSYNVRKKKAAIRLTGEATFSIKHDSDKELIVEAEDLLIRDIGTTFNVKAYPKDNTIEVSVQEGEVQLYTEQNTGISVKAGMKGIYNKVTKVFVLEKPDTNVISYATRVFVFEDTDLQTVADQLNAIYEVPITIGDNLKNCRLTVNFNNEEIDTIAEIIAETLNLRLTKTESSITLEGEGCE